MPKEKTYAVNVCSSTTAQMLVVSTSKEAAWELANRMMKESMDKMIASAEPRSDIRNLSGAGWALKSGTEIIKVP